MDLTESELFGNLLEAKDDLFHIDLHNDYTCVNVTFFADILELKFQNDKGQGYVILRFKDVIILKMQIPLRTLIIDNFHRGRYELNGELYDEYEEKKCFYIEFYEGGAIELLCRQVLLQMPSPELN
ncbi:hypothetical protein [Ohtaekwangia koreensis]|uniref:Immunity protein 50 n=1 Tax=Ohtaekwangia koreensis TaxID=688867 RepID=A0A1T5MAJ2_9BACT|nr:hypothetical protein [Ohtaekwangia koreensis]SKC85113.1 hypothetical protein SAMN05660236_4825 [Ohtaekwangia koreensis]